MTTTIHTLDPHTTGIVTRAGEEIERIPFSFWIEDAQEWEQRADEELRANGWTRTGPWINNEAPIMTSEQETHDIYIVKEGNLS